MSKATGYRLATRIITAGRLDRKQFGGMVNPPLYKGSTVLFETLEELEEATRRPFGRTFYGRMGTPTIFTFERAVEALYLPDSKVKIRAVAVGSGLAAITLAVSALAKVGKRILVADNVYAPTRRFCDSMGKRFGCKICYYAPDSDPESILGDDVALLFMESPGSLTMEVEDVPRLAAAARRRRIPTVIDNTWATALHFNPFAHGVDMVVESATKYLVGHADAMLGVIVCPSSMYKRLKTAAVTSGSAPGPDECYLAQRGIRTLHLRLPRHQENGLYLAKWLKRQKEVLKVYHPMLADCPGHKYFKRDFCGANGLFSILLKPRGKAALRRMMNGMGLFGLGYSWGGYESLILPFEPHRTASPFTKEGQPVRIHAGLEDPEDLRQDLAEGLARYAK